MFNRKYSHSVSRYFLQFLRFLTQVVSALIAFLWVACITANGYNVFYCALNIFSVNALYSLFTQIMLLAC